MHFPYTGTFERQYSRNEGEVYGDRDVSQKCVLAAAMFNT